MAKKKNPKLLFLLWFGVISSRLANFDRFNLIYLPNLRTPETENPFIPISLCV